MEVSGQFHTRGSFPALKELPITYWIEGWVGPRPSLDDMEKINFYSYRDSNSDPSVVLYVARRYADRSIPLLQTCELFVK
jgi:hypothetical protein